MPSGDTLLRRLQAFETGIELRVLVVVAHPDDETIGMGGQLHRLRDGRLLHVTDGAPRDERDAAAHGFRGWADYAAARRGELYAALAVADLAPDRSHCLGIPDQEAAGHLPRMVAAIGAFLHDHAPEIVVTHAYEGGHPDHDATACAVHVALARYTTGTPALLELTGYHAAATGIRTGAFLPGPAATRLPLDPASAARKRRMLDCFATQHATLGQFDANADEWLRPAPPYDFATPPHPGTLFYERFPWGMTGARFRALAAAVRC